MSKALSGECVHDGLYKGKFGQEVFVNDENIWPLIPCLNALFIRPTGMKLTELEELH